MLCYIVGGQITGLLLLLFFSKYDSVLLR